MKRRDGRLVPRPVVIDTDPGVDDALAILLALRSPELRVVGLTTVCGNVSLAQATKNLTRVLDLAQCQPWPIIGRGAVRPLVRPLETATHVHGADGLGDLDRFRNQEGQPRYPAPRGLSRPPTASAVWQECLRRYPRDLTLITLGPLTNVASALRRKPSMVRQFRSIVAMAGAMAVPGNVTASAEFNVYVDPEAAGQVLSASLPLRLVPLDVTARVTMTRDAIYRMTRGGCDPVCRFFREATERALTFADQVEGQPLFPFHDPLAVAVVIDPTLVRYDSLHVAIESQADLTRGATVADRRVRTPATRALPNVQVAMEVEVSRTLRLIKERLCPKSS